MAKRRGNPNWGKPEPIGPVIPTIVEFERVVRESNCDQTSTSAPLVFASGHVATKTQNTFLNLFLRRGASRLNRPYKQTYI